MRPCAKQGCGERAEASVGVRYADRMVVIGALPPEPDPNLIELCARHTDSLTPPYGWNRLDQRPASATPRVELPAELTA
ncbi:MAG TPA: DUF3499 family protein [Actinomycetota bacterium]|nr:DUF3499 family protein [Actinomycetota bacterium]